LKSGVVIRKGIKVRAVRSYPARRVKVNLSQLVRGFPGRSICLRRYIQEMKFLERSDSTVTPRVVAWGCAYREGSASKPITWPRYSFSSSTRTSDIDGRDRANGKRRGSARRDRLAPYLAICIFARRQIRLYRRESIQFSWHFDLLYLFIEIIDIRRVFDVYALRVLWEERHDYNSSKSSW